jgi:hypothetical protein
VKPQEVKAIAKQGGFDPGRMRKDELIKAIQRAEGNNDCFGTHYRSNAAMPCLEVEL